MYKIKIKKSVEKKFKKLSKKDKASFIYISKKIKEIIEDPYRFKPLRKPLQNYRRIHIGSFVLVYSIEEKTKTITIERYKHHDKVYL